MYVRITPACAGKSFSFPGSIAKIKDHPRVCGEKAENRGAGQWMRGSPPRVRGKVYSPVSESRIQRITPACAGKRRDAVCGRGCGQDHPRVCGEKHIEEHVSSISQGSPPRVRGKDKRSLMMVRRLGITPACAGKRYHQNVAEFLDGDHPRVCGEKNIAIICTILSKGSPPRVRGKAGWIVEMLSESRITPACAGKRLKKARRYAIFSFEQHTIPLVSHKAAAPICSPPPPCGREN